MPPLRSGLGSAAAGNPQNEAMTELAWWFLNFANLRNAIMHGHELTHEDWLHQNRPHIDLGDWWLRQAIKETVARDDHGDVREDPIWRDAIIGTREMMRNAQVDEESQSERRHSPVAGRCRFRVNRAVRVEPRSRSEPAVTPRWPLTARQRGVRNAEREGPEPPVARISGVRSAVSSR